MTFSFQASNKVIGKVPFHAYYNIIKSQRLPHYYLLAHSTLKAIMISLFGGNELNRAKGRADDDEKMDNYKFQAAPQNKDVPPQKDEGIDFNLMNMVGSLLHQGKQTKDASEDKTVSAVKEENAHMDEKKEVQDLGITETSSMTDVSVSDDSSTHSVSEDAAQPISSTEKTASSPEEEDNPIGQAFNWIGSLFDPNKDKKKAQNEDSRTNEAEKAIDQDEDTTSEAEAKEILKTIPVSDDDDYKAFHAFLATPSPPLVSDKPPTSPKHTAYVIKDYSSYEEFLAFLKS